MVESGEGRAEDEEEEVVVSEEDREEDLQCTRGLLENQEGEDSSLTLATQGMVECDEVQVGKAVEEEELLVEEEEEEEEQEVDGTFPPLNRCETVAHHLDRLQTTITLNISLLPYPFHLLLWSRPPPTFDNSQTLKSRHVVPLLLLRLDSHLLLPPNSLPTPTADLSSIPLESVQAKATFDLPSKAEPPSPDSTSLDERFDRLQPMLRTSRNLPRREPKSITMDQHQAKRLPPSKTPPSTRRRCLRPPPFFPSFPPAPPPLPTYPTNANPDPLHLPVLPSIRPTQLNHLPPRSSPTFLLQQRTILSLRSTGPPSTSTTRRAGSRWGKRTTRVEGSRRRGMSCWSWRERRRAGEFELREGRGSRSSLFFVSYFGLSLFRFVLGS